MEKKEYHGFDIEEIDLTGIDEINTASSTCDSLSYNSWGEITYPPFWDRRDMCSEMGYNDSVTLSFEEKQM